MLVNFSFKNFMSFRETQQFSMQRDMEARNPNWQNPDIVTAAAFYGSNASGKSNFLKALEFVSNFVKSSFRDGDSAGRIFRNPFLLDKDSESQDTEFLIELISRNVRYVYSFAINSNKVTFEELVAYYSAQPTKLFVRRLDDEGELEITFSSAFSGPKKQLEKMTRPNALFLSVAAAAGSKVVDPVYQEITSGIFCFDSATYRSELGFIKRAAVMHPEKVDALSNLIKYADMGVKGIEIRRDDSILGPLGGSIDSLQEDPEVKSALKMQYGSDIFFLHQGEEGDVWLPSASESDGTIASLVFFSIALDALSWGKTLLIDELDRSLHPVLLKDFVALFTDPVINPNQAQLVFTTHDASLILGSQANGATLDRDQIWLVQKDECGASELVAVTEYSPRSNENIGRNYLNGVYRAVPSPSFHEQFARYVIQQKAGDGNV